MDRLLLPRLIYGGLKSLIPGLSTHTGTGGTDSPAYCYSVWLRHLRMIEASGCPLHLDRVVEVGPGDSLGVCLAALLSGARDAVALDTVAHAIPDRNLAVFDALVKMLRRRDPIPGADAFPNVKPRLTTLDFPRKILDPGVMEVALAPERVADLRAAIADPRPDGPLRYVAPWQDRATVEQGSASLILTQAVMEYIDDLDDACALLARWLAPGGLVSHQIDLASHGLAETWDGHWGYSQATWALIKGNRPFFITRRPISRHLEAIRRSGLEIVHILPVRTPSRTPRHRLARKFSKMSGEDRTTRAVYVLARKPG